MGSSNKKGILDYATDLIDGIRDNLDKAESVVKSVQKAKEIINYWSVFNTTQREKDKAELQRIKNQEQTLIRHHKLLWLFIILTTVLLHVFFNKIVLLCGVQNDFLKFALITDFDVVINFIVGAIIFARK